MNALVIVLAILWVANLGVVLALIADVSPEAAGLVEMLLPEAGDGHE